MTKKCICCHNIKPLEDFPLTKKGEHATHCVACKEVRRKYLETHKDEIKRKRREKYLENRDTILKKMKEDYHNNYEKHKAKNNKSYYKFREKHLEYKKEYYHDNKEHLLQISKQRRKDKPEEWLLQNAKKRAKQKNLPIDITVEDIIVPEVCPVFGIKIITGNSLEERDSSPSLDRIIPELGYVKGNIKVISFKANSLKKDGCIDDFEKIIKYIKENVN